MLFSYLKNELNLKFKQISNISLSIFLSLIPTFYFHFKLLFQKNIFYR